MFLYHWDLVDAYFNENPIVKQHIDSYNEFVNNRINNVVREIGDIETNKEGYVIRLYKLRLEKPVATEADGSKRAIMPMEARLRNLTYYASIFIDMGLIENGVEIDRAEVFIGKLPVMIKSDLCYLKGMSKDELIKIGEDSNEPGGYFILNGSERVLVSVEDLAPNRVIVSKEKKSGKSLVIGRIFSTQGGFKAKIALERNNQGNIYISFPASPKNLNMFVILKALGLETTNDIINALHKEDEYVINDILLNLEGIDTMTTEEALDYIGKRVAAGQPEEYRKNRAEYIMDNYLLPHIGLDKNDRTKKAYFLMNMLERVIGVAKGHRSEEDKDHYANKRIKISGNLIEELFRYSMNYFVKDIKYQVERAYARSRKLQIKTLVRPDALSDRIRFSMSTGQWVGRRQGISQLLDRMSYMATVSPLRRVVSLLSKTHPHFEARDLHPTHWGKICPNETPEGPRCGLVKNLAMGCAISTKNIEGLEEELNQMGVNMIKR